MKKFDVIIVGSGPAGAMSAHKLVKSGANVLMLDGGIEKGSDYDSISESFEDLRSTDKQREIFFPNLEGIVPQFGKDVHSGSMTSGARNHVSSKTEEFLPVYSPEVIVTESLAKGGLSEAWGAACATFNDDEISQIGFNPEEVKKYYQEVADLVGISGQSNSLKLQPPAKLDKNASKILERSRFIKDSKFKISVPLLALLTQDKGERKKTKYQDLDYWINSGKSIYRSRFTIENLEKKNNFTYIGKNVVSTFRETKSGVEVISRSLENMKEKKYSARYLILAAGAINSTRLVLSTSKNSLKSSKLLVKDHFLLPCINLGMIGKRSESLKHSLCQLVLSKSSDKVTSLFAQIYSYKSLLLYKLLSSSSLPKPISLALAGLYSSAVAILDIRFPVFQEDACKISLIKRNGKETISIERQKDSRQKNLSMIRSLKSFLISLRLVPIGGEWPPLGSAAHYAGGVDTNQDCLVSNFSRVFSADSSSWKCLPAKPPTFTLMANSMRVSEIVSNRIKNERIYK